MCFPEVVFEVGPQLTGPIAGGQAEESYQQPVDNCLKAVDNVATIRQHAQPEAQKIERSG